MAEVTTPELRPDAQFTTHFQHLCLHLQIAEGLPVLVALLRQRVEVAGAGQLRHFEGVLGRGAADDDGQMIGRTSSGAEHAHLLIDEAAQTLGVEQRLGFLKQITFIGRAAPLGYEHQLVGLAFVGENFDLRRQVGTRVLFLEHVQGCHLTVAQIGLGESRGNTAG